MRTGVLNLLAFAALLVGAACTTTDTAPQARTPPAQASASAIPARGKFVLVDVASYELIAYQDGAPVQRSRIVVGRPVTPTPELMTSMYAIKFNPSWTPTPAMVRNEGLRPIPPGPNNPLGRILFELDNDELVYLHDTNQKELFNRTERAFSHGCVRVEQARPLAAWALGVSEAEIASMIARGSTYSVPLPEPIPVSLAYRAPPPATANVAAASCPAVGRAVVQAPAPSR
jgi:murein L,D-transpeptidase YcbB/YkuD